MTTGYAPPDGMGLDPRFRRDLTRRPAKCRSRYITRLLAELDTVEDAVRNHWAELDAPIRRMFHGMVVGAVLPQRGFLSIEDLRDHLQMAWALFRHRDETYEYFARSYRLRELIHEKVGQDVWAETLASTEHVAAADRGLADALAGRTIDLPRA